VSPPFDTRHVRRAFSRAAASYREHAVLQREVEDRLLERCDFVATPPQRVLDVGAGPGRASAALRKRWPKAELIALDLALPMLREARRAAGWFRRLPAVCADARALPLPTPAWTYCSPVCASSGSKICQRCSASSVVCCGLADFWRSPRLAPTRCMSCARRGPQRTDGPTSATSSI
jgi:SAM-dependent methyltransferase